MNEMKSTAVFACCEANVAASDFVGWKNCKSRVRGLSLTHLFSEGARTQTYLGRN